MLYFIIGCSVVAGVLIAALWSLFSRVLRKAHSYDALHPVMQVQWERFPYRFTDPRKWIHGPDC